MQKIKQYTSLLLLTISLIISTYFISINNSQMYNILQIVNVVVFILALYEALHQILNLVSKKIRIPEIKIYAGGDGVHGNLVGSITRAYLISFALILISYINNITKGS